MNLQSTLSGRLNKKIIAEVCECIDREALLRCSCDTDTVTAYNALWCMTHWTREGIDWLQKHRKVMIERALTETHSGKLRLIMTLLERMTWTENDIHSDFLDFCLGKINSTEPYGIRSLSMKLAYMQCRYYPELTSELLSELEIITLGKTSPALITTRRNILKNIKQ